MATTIVYRRTSIVVMKEDEWPLEDGFNGDVLMMENERGWWTFYANDQGHLIQHDAPKFDFEEALKMAKATADLAVA